MKTLLTIFVAILGLFILSYAVLVHPAPASSHNNVSGYAWSENIGWISFNCTDPGTCGGVDYGVNVRDDDFLEGHAWSDNIGWISFDFAETGAPPAEYDYSGSGFIAQLVSPANELRGWARALAGMDDPDDGWDGWIKLQKHPTDGGGVPEYGVTYNQSSGEFEGYAWGDDVVGWVSFNCLNDDCGTSSYRVRALVNSIPVVSPNSPALGDYCTLPSQQLSWVFSDAEDGASQGGYWLQIAPSSTTFPGSDSCPSCVFDSGKLSPNGTQSVLVNVKASPGVNELGFSTEYRWRIQVYDSGDLESGWAEGTLFTTPLHAYPDLSTRFTWSPSAPSEGEEVTFTDNAVFFGGPSWDWTFEEGAPATSTDENPTTEFGSDGPKDVTLIATDTDLAADPNSGTGSCQDVQAVNLRLPLPDFKEIGL